MRIAVILKNRLKNRKSAWASVFAAAVVLIALSFFMMSDGNDNIAQAQTPDDAPKYANMDGLLNELAQQYESGELSSNALTANALAASGSSNGGGSVGVIFLTEGDASDGLREFLRENGASPGPAYDGFIGADMPVSLLASASRQEGVEWMQASIPPRVAQQDGGHTAAGEHGADVWHDAGIMGAGIKVGVIAHGFNGYEDYLGTEVPAAAKVRCYSGYGLFNPDLTDCHVTSFHTEAIGPGTQVTQAVFDIVPDADYYIVHIQDPIDLYDAASWMVSNEVDVVIDSVMWVWTGPGDGTSPYPLSALNIIDDATEGDITWVVPAGHDAKSTWFGDFNDPDGDDFHNFEGDDDCNTVDLSESRFFYAVIRWEGEWSGAADNGNVEVQLVNEDTSRIVARSFRSRYSLYGKMPLRYLYFYVPRSGLGGSYCLKALVEEGDAPDWIQLQSFYGEELEHPTLHGSIGSPAESANPALLAVGTANLDAPDAIWEHSSRGPTPDGRIKPDVVGGHHEVDTLIIGLDQEDYMPIAGLEAAHTAGLASLVRQRFPELDAVETANYLRENAEDMGEPGQDNTWGYGFAQLPAEDAASPPDPNACIQRIYPLLAIQGAWDDKTCLSENRPTDGDWPGEGDYYARFYTFTVSENRGVALNLSSEADTYLYLMKGASKDGEIVALNDDVTPYLDFNSGLVVEGLEAGDYTIEATTYDLETGGDFTLTVRITKPGEDKR